MTLPSLIDHTVLHADCSSEQIRQLCDEALKHDFYAVCVPPYHVARAHKWLQETSVKVATVIGFPMGYSTTSAKIEEIKRAIDEGAVELDVVINLCALKSGNWNYVKNDISSMTTAAHIKGKAIKVILETGLLDGEEIDRLMEICTKEQPDFVKTSTGFNGQGAQPEIVRHLRKQLPPQIRVKASGGIRTREDALRMIEAGAQRIGASASVQIVRES